MNDRERRELVGQWVDATLEAHPDVDREGFARFLATKVAPARRVRKHRDPRPRWCRLVNDLVWRSTTPRPVDRGDESRWAR